MRDWSAIELPRPEQQTRREISTKLDKSRLESSAAKTEGLWENSLMINKAKETKAINSKTWWFMGIMGAP